MADRPLRPATDRRLGRPLPYQLPNPPRASLQARGSCESPALTTVIIDAAALCGISNRFRLLFPTRRQIIHVLLTRAPLYSAPEGAFRVRRACLRHAASVDSEPGSNSRLEFVSLEHYLILVKVSDNDSFRVLSFAPDFIVHAPLSKVFNRTRSI